MKLQSKSKVIALSLILSVVSNAALASGGHKGERRGPPPESIEACASLSLDQVCSFTSPRSGDEVSGMCVLRKDDDSQLACKPERGSRGGRGDKGGRGDTESSE